MSNTRARSRTSGGVTKEPPMCRLIIAPLCAQADDVYRQELTAARDKAGVDKKKRSINVVYQGELAISRLGEEAYKACMGFFQRMEEDLVPGLEVG